MNVLALDIATRTGYAHSSGESGSWLLKKAGDLPMVRIMRVWEKLNDIRYRCGVGKIIAEACHVRFVKAAGPLYELRGAVMGWCAHHEIPFDGDYAPTTIKKHATGNARASKEQMIEALAKTAGYTTADDNEADALWLLDLWKTQNVVASAS